MNPTDIPHSLTDVWLQTLWPSPPEGAVERLAHMRQDNALRGGLDVLQRLTEPFWHHPRCAQAVEATLKLHLYARILDDAIDEGLPTHRTQLLRAQPLFWQAVTTFAQHWPEHATALQTLVNQTTIAAAPTPDVNLTPDTPFTRFGHVNHLLLTAPQVLTDDTSLFTQNQHALSLGLASYQLTEEMRQARLDLIPGELMDWIETLLDSKIIEQLEQAGWHAFSASIIRNIHQLLKVGK